MPAAAGLHPDYDLIAEKAKTATVVHIQRSRGYTQRNAFDLATIQRSRTPPAKPTRTR
ncbi:hypothetical protein NIA69_19525 [Gemmiger formicilis]|nr:hypothetical protein [Gemmiger formicilis]